MGKSIKAVSTLVVVIGWWEEGEGVTATERGVSFWGDENFLDLGSGEDYLQPFKYTKNH